METVFADLPHQQIRYREPQHGLTFIRNRGKLAAERNSMRNLSRRPVDNL